ncbi:hypothetical protein ACOSQ3_027613 [Xanthoceras sorbifolium]
MATKNCLIAWVVFLVFVLLLAFEMVPARKFGQTFNPGAQVVRDLKQLNSSGAPCCYNYGIPKS